MRLRTFRFDRHIRRVLASLYVVGVSRGWGGGLLFLNYDDKTTMTAFQSLADMCYVGVIHRTH
ncbi:MAG: hypothetical protein ACLPZF_06575 [Candidatus Acidiferrales bacterium]